MLWKVKGTKKFVISVSHLLIEAHGSHPQDQKLIKMQHRQGIGLKVGPDRAPSLRKVL
jgi:hypothetical protein